MPIKTSLSIIGLCVLSFIGLALYSNIPASELASLSFYTAIANPSVRIVAVAQGERKEQIADNLATNFGWDELQKDAFLGTPLALAPSSDNSSNLEGHYFPNTYLIDKNATPADVTNIMIEKFQTATANIKKSKTTKIISPDTALKIASIIQRESGGKSDMNLISGIIWNRLFAGMKLQMDATLQYAKGNETNWWPQVNPSDKKIDSPYNTYIYADLPPTPISNPGLAAITAAYNPAKTTCLFYLHDKNGVIHCSATYAGHLKNIQKYY